MSDMDAARDIVGVSLLLTGGVAAGALLQGLGMSAGWALGLCFTLPPLLAAAGWLLWRTRRRGWLAALLAMLGLWLLLTESRCDALSPGPGPVERFGQRCKQGFTALADSIPFEHPETGPIVKALTTGDRSDLSRETVAMFRSSGASHILALSGLHLGILYAILAFFSGVAGGSRTGRAVRYGLIVGLSGIYVFITGASPSLVRAFLFIFLFETARLTRRKTDLLGSLCGALTLQLAFHPGAITSVGFQLSYLAMTGIALLYPPLKRLYPGEEGRLKNPTRYIWNAAALSIACQATTAPLAWWRFRTFPRYFLLTNLLALPLTSLVMGSAAFTLFAAAFGWYPAILTKATDALVHGLVWVLTVISGM